jgi:hypothetical protein
MHLYIETMDAVLVDFAADGRVRFANDSQWTTPSLQDRRAIIHAAELEIERLNQLREAMEG